jgi:hypothetical protein
MLRCECGWECTVLHTWSAVFAQIYFYHMDASGNEAQVICPGCHQLLFSDSKPHERANTAEEVATMGASLWGLEPTLEVGTYSPELPPPRFEVRPSNNLTERLIPRTFHNPEPQVASFLRLIPGQNGNPGKVELTKGERPEPASRGERIIELSLDPAIDNLFDKEPGLFPEVDFRAALKTQPAPAAPPPPAKSYRDLI